MKHISFFWFLNILISNIYSQKQKIDLAACENWPTLGAVQISRDGSYVMYRINNQPAGSSTITLQSINGNWKKEFPNGRKVGLQRSITGDSRKAIIVYNNDSIAIVTLGEDKIEYINNVRSFKSPEDSKGNKLAYLLNNPNNDLIIRNISDTIKYTFSSVKDYQFSNSGNKLTLLCEQKNDNLETKKELKCINTTNGHSNSIWIGSDEISNIIFDSNEKQLAFKTVDKYGLSSIWHYNIGMNTAQKIISNKDNVFDEIITPLSISSVSFCDSDQNLLLSITEMPVSISTNSGKVSVWGYKDERLQTDQSLAEYMGIYHLKNDRFTWIAKEGQVAIALTTENWLIFSSLRNWEEMNWGIRHERSPFLISSVDGKKKEMPGFNQKNYLSINVAPNGEYIVYYDTTLQSWISYSTKTFSIKNISRAIKSDWAKDIEYPIETYNEVIGWIDNQNAVLIPDKYDIWQMDLTGGNPPINITNGYGRQSHIIFRPVLSIYPNKRIESTNKNILLYGFNSDTKESGFYKIEIGKKKPILLSKGKFHDIYVSVNIDGLSGIAPPIKAQDSNVYILRRSAANTSINLYSTIDFKTFRPLSNLYPERHYTWFTTELHNWRSYDGIKTQGILYKPENFDSSKKYPVVFLCYEKMSDALNVYISPAPFRGDLNIPWLINQGYLVFAPDIHYKIGNPALSAFNHVVSAADYISRLKYVDSTKLAITGVSFGGFETNYIITHSNKFAAAVSASGISNLISYYGSLWGGAGHSRQGLLELRLGRMGCAPWSCPDLYKDNSPIFFVDKISTPVLIMANRKDAHVPFEQGIEFFTALRRLEKPCWLLQYDEGTHALNDKVLQVDYTTRVMQFLDHYLKGAPAPKWMTESVKAKYRVEKYNYFLELNSSNKRN